MSAGGMAGDARDRLLEAMAGCDQTVGLSVLRHGEMVRDHYADLVAHLRDGRPPSFEWRLPEWTRNPSAIAGLPDDATMAEYHLFHDVGKPFCRVVDADGRQHFPDHAAASERVWTSHGGSPEIGTLIGMDMDAHLLKGDQLEEFAARPQARALLLTALAEVHANASMFGGHDAVQFKMKWKHLDKRGRQVLAIIDRNESAAIAA